MSERLTEPAKLLLLVFISMFHVCSPYYLYRLHCWAKTISLAITQNPFSKVKRIITKTMIYNLLCIINYSEIILRRDPRLAELLKKFELTEPGDTSFLDRIHDLIGNKYSKININLNTLIYSFLNGAYLLLFAEDESFAVYNELYADTSLEVGKTLSKDERDRKNLGDEKVCFIYATFYVFMGLVSYINLFNIYMHTWMCCVMHSH